MDCACKLPKEYSTYAPEPALEARNLDLEAELKAMIAVMDLLMKVVEKKS